MAFLASPRRTIQSSLRRSDRRLGYETYIPILLIIFALMIWLPSIMNPALSTPQWEEGHIARVRRLRPRIGAYYYTWYDSEQWKVWKTKYQPTLGLYESSNESTIHAHADWAKHAGIDFFIMSYSKNIPEIVEYVRHPVALPIALHVESLILYQRAVKSHANSSAFVYDGSIDFKRKAKNFYTGESCTFGDCYAQFLIKAMEEIILPYHEKYLFVGERPVFVLYLARDFANYDESIMNLKVKFKQRFGVFPYLIADSVWFLDNKPRLEAHRKMGIHHWNAITAYNRYEGKLLAESLDEYMKRIEIEYEEYSKGESEGSRALMIPYVQPGYDDTMIRREVKPKGKDRPVHSRGDGKTYESFWNLAKRIIDKNPCDKVDPTELFIFISTFNEWHESTAIEPAVEWGKEYLQITRERSRTFLPGCKADAKRVL